MNIIFLLQVVLLGKYNAHGLGKDYHVLLRMTEGTWFFIYDN